MLNAGDKFPLKVFLSSGNIYKTFYNTAQCVRPPHKLNPFLSYHHFPVPDAVDCNITELFDKTYHIIETA